MGTLAIGGKSDGPQQLPVFMVGTAVKSAVPVLVMDRYGWGSIYESEAYVSRSGSAAWV